MKKEKEEPKMPNDFWNSPFNPITGFLAVASGKYRFYGKDYYENKKKK